jgi:hypothetical protein
MASTVALDTLPSLTPTARLTPEVHRPTEKERA